MNNYGGKNNDGFIIVSMGSSKLYNIGFWSFLYVVAVYNEKIVQYRSETVTNLSEITIKYE